MKRILRDVSWQSGRRFSSGSSREKVKDWLGRMNVPGSAPQPAGVFNFETKTVLLNSGYEMPIPGLGTYSLDDETCVNSVTALLDAGGGSFMPALIQNEIHPYYQENDVIAYIQNLGIVVQGWYPLGGRGYTAQLLGH